MRSPFTSAAHLGDVQAPGRTMPPGLGAAQGRPERSRGRDAAAPQDATFEFAAYVVNQLFTIALSLESARSIVGEGPAGDRIAAATDEVDCMIRDIRAAMFGLASDLDRRDLPCRR